HLSRSFLGHLRQPLFRSGSVLSAGVNYKEAVDRSVRGRVQVRPPHVPGRLEAELAAVAEQRAEEKIVQESHSKRELQHCALRRFFLCASALFFPALENDLQQSVSSFLCRFIAVPIHS
ncbi:hypothetical protein AVEN_188755-1, partial [Araneus ventricosus]